MIPNVSLLSVFAKLCYRLSHCICDQTADREDILNFKAGDLIKIVSKGDPGRQPTNIACGAYAYYCVSNLFVRWLDNRPVE